MAGPLSTTRRLDPSKEKESICCEMMSLNRLFSFRTIIATGDDVQLGVHPKEAPICTVQRDAVGPFDVRIDEDVPVGSIHAGTLDPRRSAPVGPVQPSAPQ